jgi:hypothetical protein
VCRIGACTYLAGLALVDFATFAPPAPAGWPLAVISLGCFDGLLALSWHWYCGDILPMVHEGLEEHLGADYHHACVPAWLRRIAWTRLTSEGRAHRRHLQDQLATLRALREETAAFELDRT